jgi:hypothetical protein
VPELAGQGDLVMVEYMLAQGGVAPWIGPVVRAALFTAAGVALIVVGVRHRLDRTRWDREDDRRLLHPDGPAPSDEHRSPIPRSGGTWFIAAGAVLAFLGLMHILDLVATLHESGMI